MSMKCLWTFLLLMCSSFVFLSEAKSQQVFDVAYRLQQDTIAVTGSQTFSNKINISNLTDKTIELIPFSKETMSLSGLIKLPKKIILQPNEEKSYPLKYIADRNTLNSNNQAFTIGFSSADATIRIPQPVTFYTTLNSDRALILQTDQPEYYLDQATNQVQFQIQASNAGLVPITFKVLFSGFPPGFEVMGEILPITLQPGGQVLLPFTARMPSKNRFDDFDMAMQGIDEAGNTLTSSRIRILQVGSIKRFGAGQHFGNESYNNAVAFRYTTMGEHNAIYQLQGYGDLDLSAHKKLSYRLNLDYYQNQKALNSYDTYLDYQDQDWGIKVGNIYENLDQTISGRGVKASYKMDKNRSISLYGVENNYLLFTQLNNLVSGAQIIGAHYAVRSEQNQESYLTYLHSEHDYRKIKSDQINGKTAIPIGLDQQLWIEGGYSLERADLGTNKHAVAMGANYQYNHEQYQITSMNYYSSPYYTGLRRGLIQSDTRISKLLRDNNSIAARVSYMDNNPKYQQTDRGYFFSHPNRIQIYEVGYHTGLGAFQFDLRPYLMLQQATFEGLGMDGPLRDSWKSSAIRTVGDISFFNSIHRFSLRTDYGYTYRNTSNKPLSPFHSFRLSGSYSNSFLGFNTYIQINPYYLNDLMATTPDAKYRIYSLGPNTQFTAFKGNLQAQLSTMYSYYGFSRSNNLSINGNARWLFRGNWSLTADVFYNMIQSRTPLYFQLDPYAYETSSFNNRQIRLGVEKKFVYWDKNKGHQLQLLFFDDLNHNGLADAGELRPEGLVVKIEQDVARTDGKGRVKFLNMAAGSYVVHIENNQGWVAQGPINILMTKNQSLEIPLIKTCMLKGKIKPIADKYLQTSPELSGIRIYAEDQQGKVYTTLSDANGDYTFFLPLGEYNVSIPTAGMAFTMDNPSQKVQLKDEHIVYLPDFNYKDGRRKVEIKRF
jgi:hypothetical protein